MFYNLGPIGRGGFCSSSVTRLGDFWKFLVTNFGTKVAQIFVKHLYKFEKGTQVKPSVVAFGQLLEKKLGNHLFQRLVTLLSHFSFLCYPNHCHSHVWRDSDWKNFDLSFLLNFFSKFSRRRSSIIIRRLDNYFSSLTAAISVTSKKSPNVYKVAQKWFHTKNKDFDTFTKIALECWRFGQINCCHSLWKVASSPINCPIRSHWQQSKER